MYDLISEQHCKIYIVLYKSQRLQFTTVLIFGCTVTIRWLVDFSAETGILTLCT